MKLFPPFLSRRFSVAPGGGRGCHFRRRPMTGWIKQPPNGRSDHSSKPRGSPVVRFPSASGSGTPGTPPVFHAGRKVEELNGNSKGNLRSLNRHSALTEFWGVPKFKAEA